MRFTVQFLVKSPSLSQHTNGVYNDFEQARAKCLELVESEADSAWVELTEQPELKTPVYYKRLSEPPPAVAVIGKKKQK